MEEMNFKLTAESFPTENIRFDSISEAFLRPEPQTLPDWVSELNKQAYEVLEKHRKEVEKMNEQARAQVEEARRPWEELNQKVRQQWERVRKEREECAKQIRRVAEESFLPLSAFMGAMHAPKSVSQPTKPKLTTSTTQAVTAETPTLSAETPRVWEETPRSLPEAPSAPPEGELKDAGLHRAATPSPSGEGRGEAGAGALASWEELLLRKVAPLVTKQSSRYTWAHVKKVLEDHDVRYYADNTDFGRHMAQIVPSLKARLVAQSVSRNSKYIACGCYWTWPEGKSRELCEKVAQMLSIDN
ncbi:MAG: hypothetical protein J6C87_00225 [Bacteroides sp.]|nr:hypothetical protein [Bacteroides sp.]